MKITGLLIKNFKTIREMHIKDIDNALILVGKNNTGKTTVLDAIRAVSGQYNITPVDFISKERSIIIGISLTFFEEDYMYLHKNGVASKYKNFDLWKKDFLTKFPSFMEDTLVFRFIVNKIGQQRYDDGFKKNNQLIKQIFPKTYFIDSQRNLQDIEDDLLIFHDSNELGTLKGNRCIFDIAKHCHHCFNCIGLIHQKAPCELSVLETARLMEYKLFHLNLNNFTDKVNKYFYKNGGYSEEVRYLIDFNIDGLFDIQGMSFNKERKTLLPVEKMGKGMKSIYVLSLLEAYIDEENRMSSIIMIEEPEIFLHPQLQKTAAEILFRLSKKNQVIFTTHSPDMLFNFTSKQIRQIILDNYYYSVVREKSDIDGILDDLGYTANDLLNVSFVFIVEGKQDKSRLPLLLEKYYSEISGDDGRLLRVAIITTNSCTNIKTYANLKYMNKVYLKNHFLMIRDGDGKDPEVLARQLCKYYEARNEQDVDKLPKVTRKNVLILKYYSFESYFLNPEIMVRVGVISNVEEFYEILLNKWKEYLYRLLSSRNFIEKTGIQINTVVDLKKNMEAFKTYIRGHNLYDIFYGRYLKEENAILKKYIELAPREDFADILDTINQFIYFENRAIINEERGLDNGQ